MASKSDSFQMYYDEAQSKISSEDSDKGISETLVVLYAASKSTIDKVKDATLRDKLNKALDKIYNTVWVKPGKLIRKGAGIWISGFILLFLFWWIPSMRLIAKTATKAGLIMIMIGLVFAIIKNFFKLLGK